LRSEAQNERTKMSTQTWMLIILAIAAIVTMVVFKFRNNEKQMEEWSEKIKRQLGESFKDKSICVVIRTNDGKKTDVESEVIELLAYAGVKVKYITADSSIRAWRQDSDIGINGIDLFLVGSLRTYYTEGSSTKNVVDFRLLADNAKIILGAKVVDTYRHETAGLIVGLIPELMTRN